LSGDFSADPPPSRSFNVDDVVKCINIDDKWAEKSGLVIGEEYTISDCDTLRCRLREQLYWIENSCFELVEDQFEKVNVDNYWE